MKNTSWRLIIVLIAIITAVVYLLPTIKPTFWPHKRINLGLDLQGGMHLVLEVDTQKAIEGRIDTIGDDLKGNLRKKHVAFLSVKRVEGDKIAVRLRNEEALKSFEELIKKEFPELELLSTSTRDNFYDVLLTLPEGEIELVKKTATEQALETIRNRVDQFGVSEPDIRRQGKRRILIQLPGIKDPERAKELIGKTALLEFKLVDEVNDVNAALRGSPPPGTEILYQVEKNPETGETRKTPFLLKKRAPLTGALLTDARVEINSQYNDPYVGIKFDRKGARIFERITGENIKKRLAIVLDNKVYSAPVIQDKISGGQAQITGNFTTEAAHDLAIVLRAGALPAPVIILEERTVGPSLGADSIRKGKYSMIFGGCLVILFMALYYKGSGLIADVALMLNILFMCAGLAAFQATLTLPGIAGFILTIGMAVDANVLIFERIREELHLGKTPRAAVDAGYQKATITILDANVTTLMAALVLFQFGTGPVKGFAVTLSLGVISSMFTALIMTRTIFDFFLTKRKIRTLSI